MKLLSHLRTISVAEGIKFPMQLDLAANIGHTSGTAGVPPACIGNYSN